MKFDYIDWIPNLPLKPQVIAGSSFLPYSIVPPYSTLPSEEQLEIPLNFEQSPF